MPHFRDETLVSQFGRARQEVRRVMGVRNDVPSTDGENTRVRRPTQSANSRHTAGYGEMPGQEEWAVLDSSQ